VSILLKNKWEKPRRCLNWETTPWHGTARLIKVAFAHWDVCLAAEIKRLQKPKIALPGVGAPRSIPLPLNGGFRKGN